MAKVPVTEEELKAIRVLLAEGIAINATEVMAVRQALDVCDIYNEVCAGMGKPPVVLFRTGFEGAWKNALDYISSQRK